MSRKHLTCPCYKWDSFWLHVHFSRASSCSRSFMSFACSQWELTLCNDRTNNTTRLYESIQHRAGKQSLHASCARGASQHAPKLINKKEAVLVFTSVGIAVCERDEVTRCYMLVGFPIKSGRLRFVSGPTTSSSLTLQTWYWQMLALEIKNERARTESLIWQIDV